MQQKFKILPAYLWKTHCTLPSTLPTCTKKEEYSDRKNKITKWYQRYIGCNYRKAKVITD